MNHIEAQQLQRRLGVEQASLAVYAECAPRFVCERLQGKRIPPRIRERIDARLRDLKALTKLYGALPINLNDIQKIRILLRAVEPEQQEVA